MTHLDLSDLDQRLNAIKFVGQPANYDIHDDCLGTDDVFNLETSPIEIRHRLTRNEMWAGYAPSRYVNAYRCASTSTNAAIRAMAMRTLDLNKAH